MNLFWCTHDAHHEHLALQTWSNGERMLHLDTNERSGADKWFGSVLYACRDGALTEEDYNFLHGYPTRERIRFWYHRRTDANFAHHSNGCAYKPYHVRDHWEKYPEDERFECQDCWIERKRRARVLRLDAYQQQESARLVDPRFANAVLVTPYNAAAFYFGQQRAINFARHRKAASVWIQATYAPPL